MHLCLKGYLPKTVVLQPKKQLNIPQSDYRITPIEKELLHPRLVCKGFGIKYTVQPHDTFNLNAEYAVILGARILKPELIKRYKGIINIHPGILPGNRGLDNIKWSIIKNLPIGCTAHFIDDRIDMGVKIASNITDIYDDDTIRDVYIRQRTDQIALLLDVFDYKLYEQTGLKVSLTEKFSAVPKELDDNLEQYWNDYKCNILRLSAA